MTDLKPTAVPRRLIFLNRYFYPDHSATSQMLSDLAFALAAEGDKVAVITSRQRYDAPEVRLPARETLQGVEVLRVWTSRFGRHALGGRAIDYLTFYLSAAWRLWRLARAGDIVIAKTDPPMLSVIAAPIARLRRAELVTWLQDLFPEVAEALDVGGGVGKAGYPILRRLRNASLHAATTNVVIGDRMAACLFAQGLDETQVATIPNWADYEAIRPVAPQTNALRGTWGLGNAFVVGYSGNLGRAHEIATLLDAIALVEANARIDIRAARSEAGRSRGRCRGIPSHSLAVDRRRRAV